MQTYSERSVSELVEAARAGDRDAQAHLWASLDAMLRARLRRLIASRAPGLADLDDLMQECWKGFLKALRCYNPERGMQFSTFAWMVIGQYASKALGTLRHRAQAGAVPDSDGSGRDPERLAQTRKRAARRNGRPPRDSSVRGLIAFVRREGGTIRPSRLATAYRALRPKGQAHRVLGEMVKSDCGCWVTRKDAAGRVRQGYFSLDC